ncbi:MAG: permease-like cell division protein FtsX [Bacteroidales bacterium]|nr:permease-like cell division protein FtsX [Bacteroidales bacterium]
MARPEKKLMRKRIVNAYLSSVISISLVLLLSGIAALLIVNARSVTRYLKENMHISVLLSDDATEEQARSYASALEGRPFVHTIRVVTREEGAEELKGLLGEDFLDVFETSPVPLSVDVTLKAEYVQPDSLSAVTALLSDSPLVEEVETQQGVIESLTENLARISLVFGVLILLLLFISFVLINNTVRASVFARRFSIHTMKLVGATRGFIRGPFVRAAVLQGLLSSLLAVGMLWALVEALRRSFPELLSIVDLRQLLLVCGGVVVAGVLLCVVSTWLVVNRLVAASKDDLYY